MGPPVSRASDSSAASMAWATGWWFCGAAPSASHALPRSAARSAPGYGACARASVHSAVSVIRGSGVASHEPLSRWVERECRVARASARLTRVASAGDKCASGIDGVAGPVDI